MGRNFTDTLYLVPGVSDSSGVGRANPSMSGASGLENNYVVDGVNITNTGLRRRRLLLDRLRLAGLGRHHRLHQGDPGQDRRLRGRVRPDDGRRRERRDPERQQRRSTAASSATSGPTRLEASWKQLQTPNGTVNTTGTSNYDFGFNLGGPLDQGQAVLLRHLQPAVAARAASWRPRASRWRAVRATSLDRKRQHLLLRRQADLPGQRQPPVRRLGLRRPLAKGEHGRRSGCAARYASAPTSRGFSELELRRPQPDAAVRRHHAARTGWSRPRLPTPRTRSTRRPRSTTWARARTPR